MTVHIFYDEEDGGAPYTLADDGLVLPAGATDADRFDAWCATAWADAFWVLFPEAVTDTDAAWP